MRRTFCTIAALLTALLTASAQEMGTRQLAHADAAATFDGRLYDNPAAQYDRYPVSLNRIGLSYDHRHATTPQLLEQGDGTLLWGGRIDAFLRKGNTTLWGKARYQNGHVNNQQFTETADPGLLSPYLMADTVGGGTSRLETYDFTGGFAHRLGSRWTLAGEGRYTAQMDYRTRDPRPKNLTGDLRATLGAAYRVGTYRVGAAAAFRRYKQTNELKFYDEVSVPVVYHLTGLATDYYRFRGENGSTYYKGIGLGGTLTLQPDRATGLYATLGLHSLSMDKIISSLNELPLAQYTIYEQHSSLGWLSRGAAHTWGLRLQQAYERRRGTENIFGNPAANMYPQIAEASQYRRHLMDWGAEALYQYRQRQNLYSATLSVSRERQKEQHAEPWQMMKAGALTSALSAQALWSLGRFLLQADTRLYATGSRHCDLRLDSGVNPSILPPLLHRYAYLSNDRYGALLGTSLHYDTGHRYSLFLAARYAYDHYLSHQHTSQTQVTLGLQF